MELDRYDRWILRERERERERGGGGGGGERPTDRQREEEGGCNEALSSKIGVSRLDKATHCEHKM